MLVSSSFCCAYFEWYHSNDPFIIEEGMSHLEIVFCEQSKQVLQDILKPEYFLDFLGQIKSPVVQCELIEFSITLCDEVEIQALNREHRSKDKPTDVLSFPIFEDLRESNGQSFIPPELSLGDIFICQSVAQRQAQEHAITFQHELIHLLVHGFLHLLGYDHEVSALEEKLMQDYEAQLVGKILGL